MSLNEIASALDAGNENAVLHLLDTLEPNLAERAEAAALALHLGRPRLAARWAAGHDPLLQAAALIRLGETSEALAALENSSETARVAVLRARALGTLEAAQHARTLARQQGDGPALIAAATLVGELLLPADPKSALWALAEGLKVSEMLSVEADPLLLAVLSAVQLRVGGPGKAHKTAQKALERSRPGSPARVTSLLTLGRVQEAEAERQAGELGMEIQAFLNLPVI